jgi:uncharacterized protein YjiS (DUF1127 family)
LIRYFNGLTQEEWSFCEGEDCAMRNYALHQAEASGTLPGAGLLTNIIENWRARRAVARLDRLDDFLLHDIGISRQDINKALHVPFSQNALVALQNIAGERHLSFGRQFYSGAR